MLKIEVRQGGCAHIAAEGGACEIATELLTAISHIYREMRESDPEAAAVFKRSMCRLTRSRNPVWDVRMAKS